MGTDHTSLDGSLFYFLSFSLVPPFLLRLSLDVFNRDVSNRPADAYKAERCSQKAARSTGAGTVIIMSTPLVFSVSGGTVSVL